MQPVSRPEFVIETRRAHDAIAITAGAIRREGFYRRSPRVDFISRLFRLDPLSRLLPRYPRKILHERVRGPVVSIFRHSTGSLLAFPSHPPFAILHRLRPSLETVSERKLRIRDTSRLCFASCTLGELGSCDTSHDTFSGGSRNAWTQFSSNEN